MAFNYSPKPVIDNSLVLYLDAANPKSYVSGSTVWTDVSRGGNVGTINGPTYNSANGDSIVFDGTDDYVVVNSFSFLSDYSISVWVYPTNFDNNYSTIISRGGIFETNTNFSLSLRNRLGSEPRICLYVNYDTGFEINLTSSPLNKWNNFLVTKNGTSYGIYQNSILINSGTNATLPTNGNQPLTIGKPNIVQSTEIRYTGRISNIQIYNRALTATEVLKNYNALNGRYGLK